MRSIWYYLPDLVIFNGGFADFTEIQDVYNGFMALVCVVCAGLAAGLTIGLLSLDCTKLEIKAMTGSKKEREAALRILPIIKQHHLLLCTLLLFNSIANETLPIFLGAVVPNFVAVILSVTLVLIFGEIIPSAVFTGPDQLLTAAKLTGLVNVLITVLYPIAYPISKLLDYILGEDEDSGDLNRKELEALFTLQANRSVDASKLGTPQAGTPQHGHKGGSGSTASTPSLPVVYSGLDAIKIPDYDAEEEGLGDDGEGHTPHAISHQEIHLMTGILRLSKLRVKAAMRKFKNVYMVSNDHTLDEKGMASLVDSSYSRIPVYRSQDRQHLLGYMLTRDLIGINPADNNTIRSISLRQPVIVGPNTALLEMLSIFQSGHCHMAFISTDPAQSLRYLQSGERPSRHVSLLGIVCLEDVLEKILQNDIIDEADYLRTTRMNRSGSSAPAMEGEDFSHRGLPRTSSKSALSAKLLSIRRSSASGADLPSYQPKTPTSATSNRRTSIGSFFGFSDDLGGGEDSQGLVNLSEGALDELTDLNTYQNGSNVHKMDGSSAVPVSLTAHHPQGAVPIGARARNSSYDQLEMEQSPPRQGKRRHSGAHAHVQVTHYHRSPENDIP